MLGKKCSAKVLKLPFIRDVRVSIIIAEDATADSINFFPSSNEDLLNLLFILCKRAGIGKAGEIGDKRMRLADGVILKHRHEEDILALQQRRNVLQIGRECIIGCERDDLLCDRRADVPWPPWSPPYP